MSTTSPTTRPSTVTRTGTRTGTPTGTPTRGPAGLSRRWPTAVAVAATLASLALVAPLSDRTQTWLSAWGVLVAGVIYLTWGTARGELTERPWLTAQTTGVVAFGTVAIAAGAVDLDAARYVLAAGWLTHAAWDVVHHHADRVVPRWYSELCLVCDLLLAGSLLLFGTL